MSSYFRKPEDCPFKSSQMLIDRLERIVEEEMDMEHWNKNFPVDEQQNLLENYKAYDRSCRWNCCFHVKFLRHEAGTGVHNHVTDTWNSVGELGWAGIIYLNKEAPLESGLKLWRNRFAQPYEWMTPKDRWELMDSFSNIYNRLILCRGYLPHSGGPGFGDTIHTGRLFQTFFFKTERPEESDGFDPIRSST